MGVVAMGVALKSLPQLYEVVLWSADTRWRMGDTGGIHTAPLRRCQKINSKLSWKQSRLMLAYRRNSTQQLILMLL